MGSAGGTAPVGVGGVADSEKRPSLPHMCYLTERGRPGLKGVGINGWEPPKWATLELRPLGREAWLAPDNKLSLHMC